jgi:hypothetical protein
MMTVGQIEKILVLSSNDVENINFGLGLAFNDIFGEPTENMYVLI